MSTPDAPLAKLALYHLQNIDALIIKQLFADAQSLMNAHNYDGARVKYKELIAQYPGTDAAQRASDALPQIVPVAVNYYKSEGEKNWQPNALGQFMQPQTQAIAFYEKAYKEDPDGPQAPEMLFQWCMSLRSKEWQSQHVIDLLQGWLKKFSDNPLRIKVEYYIAYECGSMQVAMYQEAITRMDEIIKKYPTSPEAAEALWHVPIYWMVIYDGRKEGYEKGLPYLERY